MIGHATAHRRANAFAQALESGETREAEGGARRGEGAQGELLALANALADLPRPTLDAEVKTAQRARLIAAMESAIADGTLDTTGRVPEQRDAADATGATDDADGARRRAGRARPRLPRSRWSRRLAVGGLTVGVAAGAFSGVAAASSEALPGDSLYGLKRGMEDLRLGMTDNDAERGQVLLDMASTRLQEARRLLERRRSGPLDADSVREVRRALSGMHNEAAQGHQLLSHAYHRDGSLTPIEALDTFSRSNRGAWSEIRGQLPPQLSDVGDQVTKVFDAIEHEVAPLQALLPPPGSKGQGGHGGSGGPGTAGHGHTRSAAPSTGTSHGTGETPGSTSASPSASAGSGLLGGTTGLFNPPVTGQSPSSGSTTQPEVTLPPLLPGLLPGLDLGGDTSK